MKSFSFAFLLVCLSSHALAHSYWIDFVGQPQKNVPLEIRLYYGEYAEKKMEAGRPLDKMKDIRLWAVTPSGDSISISTQQTEAYWLAYFTPETDGEYQILGINDTRGVQNWKAHNLGIVLPKQYLRKNFTVGEVQTASAKLLYLDTDVIQKGDVYQLQLFKDGKPFRSHKITIINPDGWTKQKTTDRMGICSFEANTPGMYLIETEWLDESPGVYKEIAYERVRHTFNIAVQHLKTESL